LDHRVLVTAQACSLYNVLSCNYATLVVTAITTRGYIPDISRNCYALCRMLPLGSPVEYSEVLRAPCRRGPARRAAVSGRAAVRAGACSRGAGCHGDAVTTRRHRSAAAVPPAAAESLPGVGHTTRCTSFSYRYVSCLSLTRIGFTAAALFRGAHSALNPTKQNAVVEEVHALISQSTALFGPILFHVVSEGTRTRKSKVFLAARTLHAINGTWTAGHSHAPRYSYTHYRHYRAEPDHWGLAHTALLFTQWTHTALVRHSLVHAAALLATEWRAVRGGHTAAYISRGERARVSGSASAANPASASVSAAASASAAASPASRATSGNTTTSAALAAHAATLTSSTAQPRNSYSNASASMAYGAGCSPAESANTAPASAPPAHQPVAPHRRAPYPRATALPRHPPTPLHIFRETTRHS
ncbi:hypothetical protein SFRURICE_012827, partial [Spodoptera frugiperda]